MAALKSKMLGTSASVLLRKRVGCCVSTTVTRQIFGNNVLAVDTYLQQREKVAIQFHGMRDKFIARMIQHTQDNPKEMVFTEDLKHMIHLVENNRDELDLMTKMVKIYSQQNAELRFATFTFGPVLMRCLHSFGADELAYKLITDTSYGPFFDQLSTYTVAMDLLWKKGKYLQVVEVFDQLQRKQLRGSSFPRDAVVLYMAACYKLNTADSFHLVGKLIKDANEKSGSVIRKAITFAAALAVNQNAPEHAIEILSLSSQKNYFTNKNLKIFALAKLNRVSECLEILKSSLQRDEPESKTQSTQFCEEVLAAVKEAIEKTKSKSDSVSFERLVKSLREEKLVTKEGLDEIICAPVLTKPPPRIEQRVGGYESRFYVSDRERSSRAPPRRIRDQTNTGSSRQGLFNSEN